MHKNPLIFILAGATFLAATAAHAEQPNGWFVNGNVGSAHYSASLDGVGSGTENDTAFIVNAGYRDQRILGFEVGYTKLGSVSISDDSGSNAKLSGDGWTFGLNGHFNPTQHWYISSRAGGFLWKLHGKAHLVYSDDTAETFRDSKQSLGWYAGVGTGYDINSHWSVGANFDYYKISESSYDVGTRIFSVSGEYRF
ncbi:MAG: porin family protein [Rhodanobacter sp.]